MLVPTSGPVLRGPEELLGWLRPRRSPLDGPCIGVLLDQGVRPIALWHPPLRKARLRVPAVAALAVLVLDRCGEGTTPRPEDIGLWRIWQAQDPDDLPILDVLLVDGDDWESLAVFDVLDD